MTGSYLCDAEASSGASGSSADVGVMAAATEYDSDSTRNVDHATDTGLGGGVVGGSAARVGMLV